MPQTDSRPPLVIIVHGGAWLTGSHKRALGLGTSVGQFMTWNGLSRVQGPKSLGGFGSADSSVSELSRDHPSAGRRATDHPSPFCIGRSGKVDTQGRCPPVKGHQPRSGGVIATADSSIGHPNPGMRQGREDLDGSWLEADLAQCAHQLSPERHVHLSEMTSQAGDRRDRVVDVQLDVAAARRCRTSRNSLPRLHQPTVELIFYFVTLISKLPRTLPDTGTSATTL
ncbi:hypothetical protein [Phytoactinopolyspora limicola]|uniref:hypothetical protein n=1 Tax=Phytoactinopolyspora limicola TaxID=2715536 RepID=UPI00140B605B|nr:hypothetical protein [Phytoactinopolyspora limicola]